MEPEIKQMSERVELIDKIIAENEKELEKMKEINVISNGVRDFLIQLRDDIK